MKKLPTKPVLRWCTILMSLAFLSFKLGMLLQPGLDGVEAIGPFSNFNLPSSAPRTDIAFEEIHTQLEWESPQAALPFPNSTKLLVVEMDGRFFTIDDNDDATARHLVLDIQDRCWYYEWSGAGTRHGGFQNAVFHPQFGMDNGNDYIYVYYLYKAENEDTDFTAPYYNRLSRFTWSNGSFDPDSELIMINQYDTLRGHDGGGLTFGNDGFLYIAIGDEGSQNSAATEHTQKIDGRFRSGIWRIDVDRQGGDISHPIMRQPSNANVPQGSEQSYTQGYYIPNDNPWSGSTGEHLEEFYALGLRQPFRMTVDARTGNLWLGEVGSSAKEEINILDKPGLNFQWNYREGTGFGYGQRPKNPIGEERTPIYEYDHSVGKAVIGGYVYRGSALPSLIGKYVFGDNTTGSVYALTHLSGNSHAGVEEIGNVGGSFFNGISSFGYTHEGELLTLRLSNGTPGSGKIFKLKNQEGPPARPMPATLSETGVFSNLQNLEPSDGFLPYSVNTPLWSAGTIKQRWVAIPQDGTIDSEEERIGYSENGAWAFPIGTVFVKHFAKPDGTKLETRLWIHGEDGKWFGSTYKWREDGSEADLFDVGGYEDMTIDGEAFSYQYPSAQQCAICHNENAGWVLGFTTRQLNRTIEYPTTGRTANQLETLAGLGFIPVVDTGNVLTSVPISDNDRSIESRARSYLDSNCAHCHLPGHTRAGFDTRLSTPFGDQGFVDGNVIEDLGTENWVVLKPGDLSRSMLYHRLNSSDTTIRMPPLANGRIDREAVRLIEAWIHGLGGECEGEINETMGNSPVSSGNFLDAHSPHITIDRTDAFTNETEEPVEICISEFTFYAERSGNPLTPFVAKVKGENDFVIEAIGETRTSGSYQVGSNTFAFSDHSNDMLLLLPGETLAPGFMDAYPDGSGSVVGQSVIPAFHASGQDDVWQLYKNTASDAPKIRLGAMPDGGSVATHLSRSYQFNIGIKVGGYTPPEPETPVVTLYTDCGYSSIALSLPVGEYPDISQLAFPDDQLSSVELAEGYQATLYPDPNFQGEPLIATGNIACLFGNGTDYNDAISSIKIERLDAVVTLYEHCSYEGNSVSLEVGEYADLSLTDFPDNGLTSLALIEGYRITLYPEPHFGGEPFSATGNLECLATDGLGLNDSISSLKIESVDEEVVVKLYNDCNFEGTSAKLSIGAYADYRSLGFPDNALSSIRVVEGHRVLLFPDAGFQGEPMEISGDRSCFNDDGSGFNDIVSSIKIEVPENLMEEEEPEEDPPAEEEPSEENPLEEVAEEDPSEESLSEEAPSEEEPSQDGEGEVEIVEDPPGETRVYPNPTDGVFKIYVAHTTGDQTVLARIFGPSGVMLIEKSVDLGTENPVEFDLSDASSGIYQIVILDSSGNIQTEKVAKQ